MEKVHWKSFSLINENFYYITKFNQELYSSLFWTEKITLEIISFSNILHARVNYKIHKIHSFYSENILRYNEDNYNCIHEIEFTYDISNFVISLESWNTKWSANSLTCSESSAVIVQWLVLQKNYKVAKTSVKDVWLSQLPHLQISSNKFSLMVSAIRIFSKDIYQGIWKVQDTISVCVCVLWLPALTPAQFEF